MRTRGYSSEHDTSSKQLQKFAQQVNTQSFSDTHFKKAYNQFKAPLYGTRKPEQDKGDGSICQK